MRVGPKSLKGGKKAWGMSRPWIFNLTCSKFKMLFYCLKKSYTIMDIVLWKSYAILVTAKRYFIWETSIDPIEPGCSCDLLLLYYTARWSEKVGQIVQDVHYIRKWPNTSLVFWVKFVRIRKFSRRMNYDIKEKLKLWLLKSHKTLGNSNVIRGWPYGGIQ